MCYPGGPMENDDLESDHEEELSYDKALHFNQLCLLHSRGELACDPTKADKFLQGCVEESLSHVGATTQNLHTIDLSTLTDTQRKLIDIIHTELTTPGQQGPGCVFVGKAGTGKSYTIKACQRHALNINSHHSMKVEGCFSAWHCHCSLLAWMSCACE
eukprot:GHVR01061381.1.p1 GENE.GHVR01061381.1~~GHVR01061381.1.p1  ORF type:complete len:182 (-),score=7.67 GHVR01061381.1:746-1219(-)